MEGKLEIEHEVVAEDIELDAERNQLLHRLIERVCESGKELGRGKLGIVKVFNDDPKFGDYCVKEVFDVNSVHTVNDIEAEFKHQQDALRLGVRVPRPFLASETADGRAFLVMETIKGCSLDDVIMRGAQLPATYEHEKYWKRAKEMLEKMRAERRHHRDIHPGNLMVEETTGDPALIDFGNATYAFGDEDPYNERDTLRGEMHHFHDDLESLRQTKIKLEKHLTELGARVSVVRTS